MWIILINLYDWDTRERLSEYSFHCKCSVFLSKGIEKFSLL